MSSSYFRYSACLLTLALLVGCEQLPDSVAPAPTTSTAANSQGPQQTGCEDGECGGGADMDGGTLPGVTVVGTPPSSPSVPLPSGNTGANAGSGNNSGASGAGGGSGSSGGHGNAPTAVRAGKFRINPGYEILAPKLVNALRNLRSFVENNPNVLNGLIQFSAQSQAQILYDLTYGAGPEVIIGQPTDVNGNPVIGQFRSAVPNAVTLDGTFINQLENTDSAAASEALSFYLAVTLLHEYTHLGNRANGITFLGEAGNAFEQAVFGVVVGESNAGQVMIQFTSRP